MLLGGGGDVSPVTYINGVGAVAAIEAQSIYQELQDPDARYNNMLTNLLVDGQGDTVTGLFT
jgi:hypothetical protein